MNNLYKSLNSTKNLIKVFQQSKTLYKQFSTKYLINTNNAIRLNNSILINQTKLTPVVSLLSRNFNNRPIRKTNDYIPVEDDLSYSPKSHAKTDGFDNVLKYESNSSFSDFDIPKKLFERLQQLGYDKPFPIQEATLKHTLAGKDCIGKAITGSGKTLAFSIPIICKIYNSTNKSKFPKALVLSPTRELCIQLQKSIQELDPKLKCIGVYGGTQMENQIRQLNGHVDVVCATPGRLRDLLQRRNFTNEDIELVCLDEADELLTPNFIEQIEDVLDTKKEKQMLMFSATINENVKDLVDKYMNDPKLVDLTKGQKVKVPENVKHMAMRISERVYPDAIEHLIREFKSERCIVFTKTKREATIFSESLYKAGFECADLHSDHSQAKREKIFSQFRRGTIKVLVATDVASRGLDIPEIDLVIQAGTPSNGLDYYIHRSGRTGRGGRPGTSVMLFGNSFQDRSVYNDINRIANLTEIPVPDSLKEKNEKYANMDESSSRFSPQKRSFNSFSKDRNFGSRSRSFESRDRDFDRSDRSFDSRINSFKSRNIDNDRYGENKRYNLNRFDSNRNSDRPTSFARNRRDMSDDEDESDDERDFRQAQNKTFGKRRFE